MRKPRIGLALSGGGARGLVHIGVLKVLTQAGIQVDCIAGTSMGGIVAAAFASGLPLDSIEEKAIRLSKMRELVKLVDPSPGRRGFLEGNRVRDFLADFFVDRTFENLKIPLALPAVDLITAQEIVFTKGLLFPAVLATIAVPGLFKPVEFAGYRLIDGGILNNLPVDRVRELGADIVIAVNAQFDPFTEKPWQDQPTPPHFPVPLPNFFLDFYRAELIMIAEITETKIRKCCPEILLHPPIPSDITMFLGFTRIKEVIAAGEQCARENLPLIQTVIDHFDH